MQAEEVVKPLDLDEITDSNDAARTVESHQDEPAIFYHFLAF